MITTSSTKRALKLESISEGHGFLGTGGIGEVGGAAGSCQIPGATVSRKGFREAQKHSQTAAEQDLY